VCLNSESMMDDFHPPEKLSFDGDVAEQWKQWRQMFELYMDAKEATDKSDKVKIGMLLSAMGPDGVERYNTFHWVQAPPEAKEDKDKYDDVIKKFETELGGEKRIVFNRYKFWAYQRAEAQTFDDYLTQLRSLAKKCDFVEIDNMIRDKIVFSVAEKGLKERLLREHNISLTKTLSLCRAFEVAKRELSTMDTSPKQPSREEKTKSVEAMTKRGWSKQSSRQTPQSSNSNEHSSQAMASEVATDRRCGRCGRFHRPNNCPAYGKTCNKCGGPNHFSYRCRSKGMKNMNQLGASVEEDALEGAHPSDDEYFVGAMQCIKLKVESLSDSRDRAWFEPVRVCGSVINMKIDSGAETNTIPAKTWKKIRDNPKLEFSSVTLKALGDTVIEHEGVAQVAMRVKNRSVKAEVYVTKKKTVPILGLKTCIELGLLMPGSNASQKIDSVETSIGQPEIVEPISMLELEKDYTDVFSGLGKFPGKYHIQLREDARPFIQQPRRISNLLYEPLRVKLKELQSRGVIAPVDKPTEWVNNLVITEKKDGSLRLCLDPKQLNEYIQREHFQMPTFDDIVGKLGGSRVFTILDQKDAYWQVELDDESSDLCVFSTVFGRYKFLRMPFGICSASKFSRGKHFSCLVI